MTATLFISGLVTLIGRPNVGKSSLLNGLVGTKVSIVARRPQTTRHRILGIRTREMYQIVYVDTPGVPGEEAEPMQRYLNRVAIGSLAGVDVIALVIEAFGWRAEDEAVLARACNYGVPLILLINKIDKIDDRARLLPLIEQSATRADFAEIIPVSAKSGDNLDMFERTLLDYLPQQPPIYPLDQRTDKTERFRAAELVREQIFSGVGQEVPYAITVSIESFKQSKGALRIAATIWVEKEGQKGILVGKKGERLKQIGTRARLAMQKLFETRVHLQLWVKVRSGWSHDARALHSLGYSEDGE